MGELVATDCVRRHWRTVFCVMEPGARNPHARHASENRVFRDAPSEEVEGGRPRDRTVGLPPSRVGCGPNHPTAGQPSATICKLSRPGECVLELVPVSGWWVVPGVTRTPISSAAHRSGR
jgi:hypothetical protein